MLLRSTDAGYAIAPRGSSVVPRPGLAQTTRLFYLEVRALLVDLHGFLFALH